MYEKGVLPSGSSESMYLNSCMDPEFELKVMSWMQEKGVLPFGSREFMYLNSCMGLDLNPNSSTQARGSERMRERERMQVCLTAGEP